jgi:hypothetical protein
MKAAMLGTIGLLLAAGGAQATTFSFASDVDHTSWTFTGVGALVNAALDPGNPQTLLVDDDNGPNPALTFAVEFRANMVLQHAASVPLGGGQVFHIYNVAAAPEGPSSFGFYLPDGSPLLTAVFNNGVFRNVGGAGFWGTGANFSASDLSGSVTYTWFGPDLPQYGLFNGQSSVGLDDAAFTFSNINSGQGPGVALNDANYPGAPWSSEGSYSGTAHFVPAPGTLALLGLGGLISARRRR